jgi:hypothetical protein
VVAVAVDRTVASTILRRQALIDRLTLGATAFVRS